MISGLLALVRTALGRGPHTAERASTGGATTRKRAESAEPEIWLYFPPIAEAGYQRIEVRTSDGYDFARLDWATCSPCQIGLIAKIRVSDLWEGKGYAARMTLRAMRGYETFAWGTTPQSHAGRRFFRSMRKSTGAAFTPRSKRCEHMLAVRGGGRGKPQPEPAPPL
ncbi:hypothetical protein PL81_12050 [Streptomyces sp. RSD-27]|nr:hypothetical protein PL81_12050 [Streptomyces sp. RSD-27]